MLTPPNTNGELLEEIERLRMRLEEAEAVVEAIRNGIVDAVVVNSSPGERVYTLEGAERPYRLLVEAMEQGVAVLNSEGVVLYCNPCLAELLKRSVQNITGCTIDSFAAEADQAKITGLWRNVERKSAHEEILLLRQDGTTFPASLAVSVLPLQNLCLLISDLTQQKHYDELIVSKAALLDSEIRYRRLLETAKDGILILDTESGRITDANPFMGELLGYSHEHFLGKELWEIGLFSDKAANEAAVRTLQDKGYIRYEHMPLETSHGLRVEVEVVANAYREDHHKVIQCNIRDITERSRLEKQTQDQASALANQDHRKDEFLAMLSHELRNPLAAITNAVQLLSLQKHEEPLQLQARTIIQRQMGQLIRLVDDLMEVSRITSGRIHLQKERTGLNSIVERAVETTRSLMDQHGHELTVSLSPQPLWLHADASRLEQVVVNLLTNAAKFTTEGGRISIAVQREGDEAVLRVKDKGVGIAAELLPHIFELFTQAERSLDRSQGGLGIGLSLVQRLAEMHEGRVEVSSVMGQGSEFVVYLPVMLNPATQLQSPLEVTAEPIGPSLRVLVVDDNVDAAQTLGLLLKATGHDARMAFDGVNAVKVALEFLPNIVLLDIGLPGLDGYEVAKRLRQDSSLDGVVLVALTGYGQATDKLRSQDAGFNHHLVKPTDFMKIKEILASVSQKTT
jgi:PAS domain S-box-containing protein